MVIWGLCKFYQPQRHKDNIKIAKYNFLISEACYYVTNEN